ncbi:extracellular solute-binding protein [Paenibacillus frigoriresistens]|uniref:ABC transporter substrate-binding protein n=1 Tax=Paenibacillus alginolyticus TaxID=59839 RepID=UPI0015639978|nr:sugar ABC transporter substrate-binding protein [Paenibacillus frigoriresistens]NRF90372.1 extracellular solute-binding protein [Paenibacillus frigoriresistens]
MKKTSLLILMVFIVSALISACSSGSNNGGTKSTTAATDTAVKDSSKQAVDASGEPAELRYTIWDTNQQPAYQKIINEFQKENKNIKVTLQVVPWANYWDKLNTEIAGGTAPDVFWNYIPYVAGLANKGALLDINPYVSKDKVDLSKFNKSLLDGFVEGDKRYAIPKDWDTMGLFYNKEALKAAGIDEFPKDLEFNTQDGGSFVKFLQKATIDKNGKHADEAGFDPKNIKQYGFMFIDRGQIDSGHLAGFAASNGATVLKDSKLQLDDKLQNTFSFLYDLVYKYNVHPSYTDVHTSGSDAKFFSGQVAVWMQGSWMMKPIQDGASFKWGIAPMPKGPAGRVVRVNGLGDTIYSKSKHPEAAWKFASFIASQKGQDILGETGTVFPGNSDSISKFVDFYKGIGIDPTVFVDEFKGGTTLSPAHTNQNEWSNIFVKYSSLSLAGQMDPVTAMKKIKEEGDAIAPAK